MRLSDLLRLPFRRRSGFERLVEQSVRDGVGLRRQVWVLPSVPLNPVQLNILGERVTSWVEEEMGAMRRPYGIDHVALGMACASEHGSALASASFGLFRTRQSYEVGGTREEVVEFVESLEDMGAAGDELRLAAALFSWGDLARATVFRDPQSGARRSGLTSGRFVLLRRRAVVEQVTGKRLRPLLDRAALGRQSLGDQQQVGQGQRLLARDADALTGALQRLLRLARRAGHAPKFHEKAAARSKHDGVRPWARRSASRARAAYDAAERARHRGSPALDAGKILSAAAAHSIQPLSSERSSTVRAIGPASSAPDSPSSRTTATTSLGSPLLA